MGKTVRFCEDSLIALKKRLNEIMVGIDDVSHNDVCINEIAPEVDKYTIGGEETKKGGVTDVAAGGNCFHAEPNKKKKLKESVSLSQDIIDTLIKFRPDKYKTWAVIDVNRPQLTPHYFEKKKTAIEFKRWHINKGDVVVNLNDIIKEGINEGYLRNRLSSIDLSEVGRVDYSFDFDEDEYNEWLAENELQDSEESKYEFYKDQWEYNVEYCDNICHHYMDSDSGLSYDDLEDLFGEKMAETIVRTCMRDGKGYFDTDELYEDEQVDINNPEEVNAFAMKLMNHGDYFKGCRGFILTNGVCVYTALEHNEILRIPGIKSKFHFIELGNIRLLPNSIDIGAKPTSEQWNTLRQVAASYSDGELYVDIFTNSEEIGVKYVNADYHYVLGEIERFYSEGIRPQGGSFDEAKKKDKKVIMPENKFGIITENSTDRRVNSIIAEYSGINDFDEIRKKRAEILRAVPNARAKNDMYLGAVAMYYLTGCLDSEYRFKLNRLLAALNKGVNFGYRRILDNVDFNMTPFDELKTILDSVATSEKSVESYEGANKDEKIQRVGRYTIYRMDSYDDAKYLNENFRGLDIWCVFNEDEMFNDMFNGYTAYLCIRDGYKNAKEAEYDDLLEKLSALNMNDVVEMIEEEYPEDEADPDFVWDIANDGNDDLCDSLFLEDAYELGLPPCDDYGLSLMVVMISNDENTFGSLGAVYSRYNLPNLYDGDILDEDELSEVIGAPYQSVFKPYKNEEVEEESKKSKKVIIPENKLAAIKENIEKEVESSEVDLSSFRKRDTLPPKIWKDEDTLDSRVRLKLLDIAYDFWEFVNLTWVEPKGIIMTGSMCNFNWSELSDIDLHLIVDFNEVDEKKEFVKQYLDSKKNEWNNEHEGLKIMGFPVEVYVQDVDDSLEAGGIYDLEENAWTRKPDSSAIKSIGLDKFSIKDKVAEIMTIIDDMYNKLSTTSDGHEVDQIGDDAHYLWDKVKDLRKKSLTKNGESGSGNIVYKVLRRTGYLDKLFKLFSKVYDRSNSITEGRVQLITESQESKSIEEAKRLLIARGQSEERADWMVRYALRHDMPAFAHNPKAGKFILGVVRMYLDRQIMDATTIFNLDESIKIAATDEYYEQFDRNLNGMSAQEVIDMFAPIIREINRQYREQVNSTTYELNNRYTIVPIRDYRHATEFRQYSDWCLCELGYEGERSYDSYTCDGLCQLYFCLRDDYREMTNRKEIGEGCPLDDYGLSMIAITVSPEGNLRTCTTRWNHENGGSDKIMNPVEISNVIGRNFYDTFKPASEVVFESVNMKKYLTLPKEGVNIMTESKIALNEVLDNNYGMPLYSYFRWADKASDREKVEDLFYRCPWVAEKYLEDVGGDDEELEELYDAIYADRYIVEDEEFMNKLLDALERNKLLIGVLDNAHTYASSEDLPAWFTMDFVRFVNNEWCIHFTSDAHNIAREGFTGGTPDIDDLAYTGAGIQKHYAGYDFAFLIHDRSVDFNGYGDEAVIFRASGVLVTHYGDMQDQVIFWGPSVKEIIPIKKDDYSSDWKIEGLDGQIFKTGKPSELAYWATDNLPQYRKQILAGKSGYRPWGFSRPPYYNEYMKSPFSNESVKKYLTLLKEEVAMDGSSEDNPYKKRWKAERDALKNFVATYGKLMQSREDNKNGKLYKVYFDETMSNLIGFNYCICVQWDEQEMKPGSTVYIRALDKFTPFIRRNLQFDTRGRDNMRGTYDDSRMY